MVDDVARFEKEALETRERIAATVEDLQQRLSPRALFETAIAGVEAQGADAFASIGKVVRNNPASIAGIGVALGAALLGRSYIGRAKIDLGDKFAAYPDYDDGYGANSVDDRWHADHAVRAEPSDGRIERHARTSPLLTMMVAVAAGAIIGSLLPITEFERELAEPYSD